MEKLIERHAQLSSASWKKFEAFMGARKRQFIRSTIAFYEPIVLLWRYIKSPAKKSPLRDLKAALKYMITPYPDSLFEDEKP